MRIHTHAHTHTHAQTHTRTHARTNERTHTRARARNTKTHHAANASQHSHWGVQGWVQVGRHTHPQAGQLALMCSSRQQTNNGRQRTTDRARACGRTHDEPIAGCSTIERARTRARTHTRTHASMHARTSPSLPPMRSTDGLRADAAARSILLSRSIYRCTRQPRQAKRPTTRRHTQKYVCVQSLA